MNQSSDQYIGALDEPLIPRIKGNKSRSSKPESITKSKKIVATCLFGLMLSSCVGASVNNSLDVAALDAPQDITVQTLDQTALGDEQQIASTTVVPVPARSPISSQTALLPDDTSSKAIAATEKIIAESPQTAQSDEAVKIEQPTQTASLEPQAAETAPSSSVVRPVVPQEATVTPKKTKKSGGIFGFLFGGNKSAPTRTASVEPQPKSKTTISTVPSKEALNGSLPGVKRNSAIFGINDESKPEEENVQVASVGAGGRILSPAGLILQTERVQVSCFKPELMRILASVERKYGKKVIVTSGYRSPKSNRRAGGARNSTHIYCKAADIQVDGVSKWDLAKYLRSVKGRGGVGTYCRTKSVHIDVGTQRDWHHPCRRSKKRKKA